MLPGTAVWYSGEVGAKVYLGCEDGMVRAKPEQLCLPLSLPQARKETGDLSGCSNSLKRQKDPPPQKRAVRELCSRGSRAGKRDLWVIWSWTRLVKSKTAALGEHRAAFRGEAEKSWLSPKKLGVDAASAPQKVGIDKIQSWLVF